MNRYAIILAGGAGTRMKTGIPKQFIPVKGMPVLMHSFQRFREFDPKMQLIAVLPEEHIPLWKDLCTEFSFGIEHQIVRGGKERFHSVRNGLQYVEDDALVAIHDGVRPMVSQETIQRVFETAELKGNAIPAVSLTQSIRKIKGDESKSLVRDEYRLIQTPQCFNSTLIKRAYDANFVNSFTDDASVLEHAGHHIHLVEGNHENIKITLPMDIQIAESLMF
jgi:2-C-methyl-D-erythritol 4-phosphate cytidylyltransferase